MKFTSLLILAALTATASALEMPNIFSDHMVLQQQTPVTVWGNAKPNAMVRIEFAGQESTAKADTQGKWTATLPPLDASFEGRDLTVKSGESTLIFHDVLVGEVWLGSGQSNMLWRLDRSTDGDLLMLGANDPYLRLYHVNYAVSTEPKFSCAAVWKEDSPDNAGPFSGVAYQFARDLRKTLNVPVGIIQSAVGGTPVIAWTRQQAFSDYEPLARKQEEWNQNLAAYEQNLAAWEAEYDLWKKRNVHAAQSYEKNVRLGAPKKPEGPDSPHRPATLANAMISPIAPYTVRGVVWYQGEADARWEPEDYGNRLGVMINDWRRWWGNPEMPFGIVQLANFGSPQDKGVEERWPKLRESQRLLATSDPHVGMVVAIDVGEADDIHPTNKSTVARRLARWALADVYRKLTLAGGPQIASASLGEHTITLSFDRVGGGLRAFDGETLQGFAVEADNGNFVNVPARIKGKNEVLLSTKGIKDPKRVRYAWHTNPTTANLSNEQRQPASPFQITLDKQGDPSSTSR